MNRSTRSFALLAFALVLMGLSGCNGQSDESDAGLTASPRVNVKEVEPAQAAFSPKAGQLIYVPVYSAVSVSDRPHLFNVAINFSFRNTDQKSPVILKSARYYDGDGKLLREYAPKPLRIGPLASADFFIKESDKAGGQSACFLLEWIAEESVTNPIAESVMVGTANTQGVSFVCTGRVLSDLAHP